MSLHQRRVMMADDTLTLYYKMLHHAGTPISAIVKRGPVPTFTRSGTAWYFDENGLLISAGTDEPRFDHNFAGTPLGLLIEQIRINEALHSRDRTQAAWINTNITAAKDAVGLDGSANSCSTLTATAANGTSLQTVTKAAEANSYSVYIKRKTGTGDIDITVDGGTTWTTCTGLSAVDFTRYYVLGASAADPTFGVRIVADGDAVIVDCDQLEGPDLGQAPYPSSPILTTTAAVTRNSEFLLSTDMSFVNQDAGTVYISGRTPLVPSSVVGTGWLFVLDDGGTTDNFSVEQSINNRRFQGEFVNSADTDAFVFVAESADSEDTEFALAVRYADDDVNISADGVAGTEDTSVGVPTPDPFTTMRIGRRSANNFFNGHFRSIKYYDVAKTDAEMNALTA